MYLPVIHAGYERFFNRHRDASELLLLGEEFANEYPVLKKEIRALSPDSAAGYVRSRPGSSAVRVVAPAELSAAVTADVLVVPDEQLLRDLVARYELAESREVVYERTFLRWDRAWSLAQRPVDYDGAIAEDELSTRFLQQAADAANASSDWWRQVGAVAVLAGQVLDVQHNQHRPTEYTPYLDGDPRNDFHRGVRPDLSTAIHAESVLVARAARHGLVLDGADLYVSTFPCPGCARMIAEAGFRRCFFAGPYAMLDGETILRGAGVELIWVDMAQSSVD